MDGEQGGCGCRPRCWGQALTPRLQTRAGPQVCSFRRLSNGVFLDTPVRMQATFHKNTDKHKSQERATDTQRGRNEASCSGTESQSREVRFRGRQKRDLLGTGDQILTCLPETPPPPPPRSALNRTNHSCKISEAFQPQ